MNILKLKFKLENEKEKTLSVKNAKAEPIAEDVKALGDYIAANKMITQKNINVASYVGAVLETTSEKPIA